MHKNKRNNDVDAGKPGEPDMRAKEPVSPKVGTGTDDSSVNNYLFEDVVDTVYIALFQMPVDVKTTKFMK